MNNLFLKVDLFGQDVSLICDPTHKKVTSGCGGFMTIVYYGLLLTFVTFQIIGMYDHSLSFYGQFLYQLNSIPPEYIGEEFRDSYGVKLLINGLDISSSFDLNLNKYIHIRIIDEASQKDVSKVKFEKCESHEEWYSLDKEVHYCMTGT